MVDGGALILVVNSPELCGDLRGDLWSLCMLKLEGELQDCKNEHPRGNEVVSFYSFYWGQNLQEKDIVPESG